MEFTVLASSSKGNCYHVQGKSTQFIIECGLPWRKIRQGLNFNTSEIEFCLLSHEHKDHSGSHKDVIKAGIDIYTSKDTIDALRATGHRIKVVENKKQFTVKELTILPFELEHDVTNYGYLIADSEDKLLFLTDTFYCRYKFEGVTILAIECNYADDILRANVDAGIIAADLKNRLLKSHFSLKNVKEFLRLNDLSKFREIYLIHLSQENADPERFKKEIQQLTGKPTYIAGGE